MTTKKEKRDGFSITSLVLSIVGALLCLSIVGIFIGLPAVIVGLIFGIIALVKKQKKIMAIVGISISSLVILISVSLMVIGIIFVRNNADVLIEPIKEFSQMIEQNPELSKLMSNEEFANEFEYEFKNKMIEKFGEETEIDNRDEVKTQIPGIFEEMKSVMLELQKKHQD